MNEQENHILVIFGASGDLTERKLVPALYNLHLQDLLPERFAILGVGRTQLTDEAFREKLSKPLIAIDKDGAKQLNQFMQKIWYLSTDPVSFDGFAKLKSRLSELNAQLQTHNNYIFYLATPPQLYTRIANNLGLLRLNKQFIGWKRLVIEKPFGTDLKSSIELNHKLLDIFDEEQIYRIDHYLGKETVQNILITRFSNGIFEPIWNRNYIHHIEITSAENIGIENRGGYYEHAGALRDMVQNHLMQLVGLVAMEPPIFADAQSIRNEMLKVFQSLRQIQPDEVPQMAIRGQYTESTINGKAVNPYRQEKGVAPKSKTETYAALKFFIDNWRWSGIPFYIRTGKRLPTKVTEIVIYFKPTPHHLFSSDKGIVKDPNQLIIRIQPDEGVLLKFGMKTPGAGFNVQTVGMDFHYSELRDTYLPTAYERLLLDCMAGDQTLYAHADAVEATWRFIEPIRKAWDKNPDIKIYGYPAGTWGPDIADNLFSEPYIKWRYPCRNLANDGVHCEL